MKKLDNVWWRQGSDYGPEVRWRNKVIRDEKVKENEKLR